MSQITGAVIAITRGAGGGVHPERAADRQRRRDLPAVRADDRDGDAVLGVPRAGLHAGAVRDDLLKPSAHHDSRNLVFRWFNQRLRLRAQAPTSATSAAPCAMRRAG